MQTFAQSIESDLSSLQRDGRHLSVALRLASNGDEDLREVCQAAAAGLVGDIHERAHRLLVRLGARLQRREGVRIELDPDVRADLVALQAIAGGDTRRAPVEQARVFELGRRALGLVERLEIGTREYLLSTHRSSGASNGPATA